MIDVIQDFIGSVVKKKSEKENKANQQKDLAAATEKILDKAGNTIIKATSSSSKNKPVDLTSESAASQSQPKKKTPKRKNEASDEFDRELLELLKDFRNEEQEERKRRKKEDDNDNDSDKEIRRLKKEFLEAKVREQQLEVQKKELEVQKLEKEVGPLEKKKKD